jgi:hypothetical protein
MITLFPSRCYNGGARHKFEAQVLEQVIPGDLGTRFDGVHGTALAIIAAKTRIQRTYLGHVCVWCGAVVNAPQPSKET